MLATLLSSPQLLAQQLPSLSGKVELETVLRLAVERSPRVREARHHWQAAKHLKPQAYSLPDPQLSYNYFARSIETRTGPQRWSLGISQTVPYPEKLILRAKIANRDARIAYLRYESAVRDALAQAKLIYFELYYIDRARGVTASVAKLYERFGAQAAGDDQGLMPGKLPETFRAESQRAQLGYDLVLLEEMRQAEEEALRSLLALPPGRPIGPTEDVAAPIPLQEPPQRLYQLAQQNNQELLAAGVELDKSRLQAKLARRSLIPDFTFSANYFSTGDPLQPTFDGGRDPLAVGVGINLPIWFWKDRARLRQAREAQRAAEAGEEAQRLSLRSQVAKAYFQLSNASRLVRLYRATLIPQARQAMQSAEALYKTGAADLSSLLETTAAYHNFELASLRAVADYYQNVARLEQFIGTALEPRPQSAGERP